MDLPNPVDLAIPGFILLVLVEMIVARLRDRKRYCPKDTLTSLALGAVTCPLYPQSEPGQAAFVINNVSGGAVTHARFAAHAAFGDVVVCRVVMRAGDSGPAVIAL